MTKFPIVGMQHRKPAPTVLSFLGADTPLYMVREPTNEYDTNAIQVWVRDFNELVGGDGEILDTIRATCEQEEIEAPDLNEPFMLGYIKAQSVNEDVLGAEVLAPRIDAMIENGEIEKAEDIPCKLVYGETGRPSLTIIAEPMEEVDPVAEAEEAVEEFDKLHQDALASAMTLDRTGDDH